MDRLHGNTLIHTELQVGAGRPMGRRSVPPLTAVPIEMGRNRGVSDPASARWTRPTRRSGVAHASVPGVRVRVIIRGAVIRKMRAPPRRSSGNSVQVVLSVPSVPQDRRETRVLCGNRIDVKLRCCCVG